MLEKEKLAIGYLKGVFYSLDPQLLSEGASPELSNTWVHKGVLRRFPGTTYHDGTDTAPGTSPNLPVCALAAYYHSEEFQYYIAYVERTGGGNSVYKIDSSGWTLLHTGTFTREQFIQTVQKNNHLWVASHSQVTGYWDNTSFVTPADYATLSARSIISFYNHMLICYPIVGATHFRYKVQWSVFGDFTDLTGETSGYLNADYSSGECMGFGTVLDRLFLFKTDSIWEIIYIGGDTVFSAQPVVTGIGTLAPKTIVSYDNKIYFYGTDDIYAFDGREAKPIGGQIKRMFFGPEALTSKKYAKFAQGIFIPALNEYWLATPTGAGHAQDLFVYKIDYEAWYRKPFTNQLTALLIDSSESGVAWEEMTQVWTTEDRTWGSVELVTSTDDILLGQIQDVLKLDLTATDDLGSYTSATWLSKHLALNWSARWSLLRCESKGTAGVTLEYSKDEGETWVSLGSQSASSDTVFEKLQWGIEVTSETMQFRLTLGSGEVAIRVIQALVQPRRGAR